ncbi:phenylalanine 4-monooxygenase [Rhodohalobacter sp.]|uniref:phenylalanine 4-monooxygenase n=1 Tax=Rhodohalobacter sp. TaxID=1974210 RepID=UPI0035663BEC
MEKMIQDYSKYTEEDSKVWNTLFERQKKNLPGKANAEYLNCLTQLNDVLNPDEIVNFDKLNEYLIAENGWSVVVVPGLIPVADFFKLLSEKKFCSSTWLRKMDQLDYLEEPDMFHDIFGHIPLLMNADYARFVEEFGKLGVEYGHNKIVEKQLQRLYWFTVEFGLIKQDENTQIYGAGIISSAGETDHIFEDNVEVRPYMVDQVLDNDFITSEIQTRYYEIGSFEELFNSVGELEKNLKEEVNV